MKRFLALMMALMLIFSISVSSVYATQVYVISPGYSDEDDPDPDPTPDPPGPGPGPGDPDSPKPGAPGKPGAPDPGAPGKPGKPVGPDSPKPGKPISPQTGYVMGVVGLSAVAAASGAVAVIAGKKASKRD